MLWQCHQVSCFKDLKERLADASISITFNAEKDKSSSLRIQ